MRRLNIIYPFFNVFGGGERVFLDFLSWAKKIYDTHLYTLYDDKNLKGLRNVHIMQEGVLLSSMLGYKANPFGELAIRKAGMRIAMECSKEDLFLLGTFPATIMFSRAAKARPELWEAKTAFLCFEPDRMLYYGESKRLGYLPKTLINHRTMIGSMLVTPYKKEDRETVMRLKKTFTMSEFVSKQVKGVYGIDAKKAFEHYTAFEGPSEDRGEALRKRLGLGKKDKVFLSLGRLEHGKGISRLLRLFPTFSKRHPDARLIIGGKGELEETVKEAERKCEKIRYLGFVPDSDLHDLYSLADVFCFFGEKETGGPLTVLDAMATDTIVIVPDDGGAAFEIVADKENGFVAKNDDESVKRCMEDAMRILEDEPGKAEKMKHSARTFIKKHASRSKAEKDFLAFLSSL